MADRQLKVTLVGDSRQLDRTLGKTETRLKKFGKNVDALGGGVGFGGSSKVLKGGAIGLTAGVAAKQLFNAAEAASDLNEQISKSGVVFGKSSADVERWSTGLAKSFGVAQTQALEAASTFGALFRNTGQNAQSASRLGRSLVELGADLASFNNTSVDDALDALRSGLSGEIEPLRRFQVFLTEAAVAQRALADTHKTSSKALTQGEKIMARYELIVQQTKRAQGDFARTSGGLANQQRILSAQWANLQVQLGKGLVPVLTKGVSALNETGSAVKSATDHVKDFTDKLGLTNEGLLDIQKNALAAAAALRTLRVGNPLAFGPNNRLFPAAPSGIPGKPKALPPIAVGPSTPIRSPLVTQVPNQLRNQEADARLSRNKAALKAVLAREAQALQSALKDPRLRQAQKIAINPELLGINDEIAAMDDELIQAAKDKKQAAADARKKAAAEAKAAKKKLAQANRDLIAKFKDQADAIKSAVLDAFDTKTDKINNARALADAKAALRVARQIGGPEGIKLAQRDVTDAQRAIRRQQLEDTTFRVRQGPAGPVNALSIGNQTINVYTSDPEKAARDVIRLMNKKTGAGAPRHRGRNPGRP